MPVRIDELQFKFTTPGANEAGATIDQVSRKLKSLNQPGGESGGGGFLGIGKKLRDMQLEQRASGEVAFEKMLKGGVAGGFASFIGEGLAKMTESAVKMSDELRNGKVTAGEMIGEIASGIPVIGGFVKAGLGIAELFTHAKRNAEDLKIQIEENEDAMKRLAAVKEMKLELPLSGTNLQVQQLKGQIQTEEEKFFGAGGVKHGVGGELGKELKNDPRYKDAKAAYDAATNHIAALGNGKLTARGSMRKEELRKKQAAAEQEMNSAREFVRAPLRQQFEAENEQNLKAQAQLVEQQKEADLKAAAQRIDIAAKAGDRLADAKALANEHDLELSGQHFQAVKQQTEREEQQNEASRQRELEAARAQLKAREEFNKEHGITDDHDEQEMRENLATQEKRAADEAQAEHLSGEAKRNAAKEEQRKTFQAELEAERQAGVAMARQRFDSNQKIAAVDAQTAEARLKSQGRHLDAQVYALVASDKQRTAEIEQHAKEEAQKLGAFSLVGSNFGIGPSPMALQAQQLAQQIQNERRAEADRVAGEADRIARESFGTFSGGLAHQADAGRLSGVAAASRENNPIPEQLKASNEHLKAIQDLMKKIADAIANGTPLIPATGF